MTENSTCRILTVRQPWAWAIIHGGKNVENRVRNIAGEYRGPVLIHAAITSTAGITDADEELLLERDVDGKIAQWLEGEPIEGGVIIGVVDLVDVHTADDIEQTKHLRGEWPTCSPWAERRGYHLVLENPRALDEPIPYTGMLGLRRTDFFVSGDWLGQYIDPGHSSCTPYGCPPSCYSEPAARLVPTGPRAIGPDCRDGKCAACVGDAWDAERDKPTACQHECHLDSRGNGAS